jgi:hypothetical protein
LQSFAFCGAEGDKTAENVVERTDANKCNFSCKVINGKTFLNISGREYGPYSMDIRDLHYISPGDFAFMYKTNNGKEESFWINVSGRVYGPFERGELFDSSVFAYKLDGSWYENNNGILKGPFRYATPHQRRKAGRGAISPDGTQFIMEEAYDDDNKCQILNINGTIVNVKGLSGDYIINDSGQYTYFFWNKKKLHVCINGRNYRIKSDR